MKNNKIIILLMIGVICCGGIMALIQVKDYDIAFSYTNDYRSIETYEVQNGVNEEDIVNIQ